MLWALPLTWVGRVTHLSHGNVGTLRLAWDFFCSAGICAAGSAAYGCFHFHPRGCVEARFSCLPHAGMEPLIPAPGSRGRSGWGGMTGPEPVCPAQATVRCHLWELGYWLTPGQNQCESEELYACSHFHSMLDAEPGAFASCCES